MSKERTLINQLVKASQKEPKSENTQQQNTEQNKTAEQAANDTFRLKTIDEIINQNENTNPGDKE